MIMHQNELLLFRLEQVGENKAILRRENEKLKDGTQNEKNNNADELQKNAKSREEEWGKNRI